MATLEQKLAVLKRLDTKSLIASMYEREAELETVMIKEATFKSQNQGYLSTGGDCKEVKRILAELAVQAPETKMDGTSTTTKKTTAADKEEWLMRQRTENKELNEAITKQLQVAFVMEQNRVTCDTVGRRLAGIRAILALKTAQISFLAGD